jgi:hypothetical protein
VPDLSEAELGTLLKGREFPRGLAEERPATPAGEKPAPTQSEKLKASLATLASVDAHRANWRMRSFQFFGIKNCLSLWDELRRLKKAPDDARLRELWVHARGGEAEGTIKAGTQTGKAKEFLEAMGGLAAAPTPVQLELDAKVPPKARIYTVPTTTRYGENPYAEQLSFHARHARARRDHEKYLTLIDAIALLHQHQRPVRTAQAGGAAIEYIEVTREDIEAAHVLANDVLGRSLDELPPVTRKLLRDISAYVAEQAKARQVQADEVRFTRRELRDACGWGDTQLRLHVQRLADLELLASERGGPGGQVRYWLQYEADDDSRARLCGLVDPSRLVEPEAMTAKSRGAELEVAAPSRAGSGPVAGTSRVDASAAKPVSMRLGAGLAAETLPSMDSVEAVNGRSYMTPQVAATA